MISILLRISAQKSFVHSEQKWKNKATVQKVKHSWRVKIQTL